MENKEIKEILSQIKTWLIIIAVLLLINVFVLILVNGDEKTTDTNNIVESNGEYDVSQFEQLSAKDLFSKINGSGYHVVYIGRSSCGYCTKFIPVMQQAQKDLGFKTLYFDITEVIDFEKNAISDQEAYDTFAKFDSYVEENFGSTPMVLVFKDGKYVNGTVGYTDVDTYKAFLSESGIK